MDQHDSGVCSLFANKHGVDTDSLPCVTITPLDEAFAKKINSFTLSDQCIETNIFEDVLEKSHVERSHDDINRLTRFFREYMANEGDINPFDYVESTDNRPPGTKTIPTIFPTKLCGILGHPGTGKSNSMGKFTAGHETATCTGSTNMNTANQQKTTESYAMPNSYDPSANMSTRTLFHLNKIKLSKPDVEKAYQEVTADKYMVNACNAVYDPNGPFMANASRFDQKSVNEEWCRYLKAELKGVYPLFMVCKEEFDKEYMRIGRYARRCLPVNHPHHQPVCNRLPVVIDDGINKRYTTNEINSAKRQGLQLMPPDHESTDLQAHANVTSHEKYVKLIMSNLDLINEAMGVSFYVKGRGGGGGGGGGGSGSGVGSGASNNKSFKSVINQITHTEFVVDEAGLSYGFLLTLTEMMITYTALLYNTVPLHTRVFTIFLNGSFTQGKAAGDYPYSTLEQVNAVSSQTDRCTSVVSILNRRRTNEADDPVAVLHNSIVLHTEFNIPMGPNTYEILRYQEVPSNKMYDTNYRMDAMRLFQKHDTCDMVLKNAHRDGLSRVCVKDTILASTRIVYLDTETKNVHYSRDKVENIDEFPHGTNNSHLSTLTSQEARRNITKAFIGFYKEHEYNCLYADLGNFLPEDCNEGEIEAFTEVIRNKDNPTNLTDSFGFFNKKVEKIIQDRTRETDDICVRKRERLILENKKRIFCDIEMVEGMDKFVTALDIRAINDNNDGEVDLSGNITVGDSNRKREKIKRVQGLCHIIGPAAKLLHRSQHLELRRNCRVLERNLKDSELFDSSAAQNQRGNTKTKTMWYKSGNIDALGSDKSSGNSATRKEIAWFYNPELDMVRIIAMPDFTLLNETKSYETNMQLFEDSIQRSVADMQMFMAYQRIRHLKENGMTTSTLQFTNTTNKGVKISLDKLLTNRLFENTSDVYKVCVFSSFLEEAYTWLLKKYEQELMKERITNHMKNAREQKQQQSYTDFNSLTFKDQYDTDEYKDVREKIPDRVAHVFEVYRELIHLAEHDAKLMFAKRGCRKAQRKQDENQQARIPEIRENSAQNFLSSTRKSENGLNPEVMDTTDDGVEDAVGEDAESAGEATRWDVFIKNVVIQRNIPIEAYPGCRLSNFYFTHLQRLVQLILSDDENNFNGFLRKVISVYTEQNKVFFTLFGHNVSEERFPISCTMSPGSLVLLGNGYHEACEGDVVRERKALEIPVTETYQKHLDACEKWLKEGTMKTSGKFAPLTILQANEEGYKRWHPKVLRDSVTTYHAYDIFILTTIPACDNKTKYEYVFNGFAGTRIKESILRKTEPNKIIFGYYTRQNEPNRNEKKNLFHRTMRSPYARGFNFSADAESYYTTSAHGKTCVTDMTLKSAYQTYPVYINPGSTANCLEEQNSRDMHEKKNDSDSMYAIRADGVPAFVSTITPIQGLTLSCMMLNDFGDLDSDYVMMLLSRASDVHKVRVSGVSTAKRRLLMPDSINPVGGSKSETRKDYLRFFNDPQSLRRKRKITKSRNYNMIYRP